MNAKAPDARTSARSGAPLRDWAALSAACAAIALLPERTERMRAFVSVVWDRMHPTGLSWVGFYVDHPGAQDAERLHLAAREPKPACSPIGIHGACGACLVSGRPVVVRDIRELGQAYIACDPRDLSEVVVPCRAPDGTIWGVLDLDSHEIGSFHDNDAAALGYLLRLAGVAS